MAKSKKKNLRRPAPKVSAFPASTLAPQILEKAAQGWLQSSGSAPQSPRPGPNPADHRLTEALTQTLQELRSEIAELRARFERLENR
jgi:hypothetical protein